MKNFSFVKHSKAFLIIVCAVVAVGILSFFIRGFNLDTDFIGGTTLELDMGREVTSTLTAELADLTEDTVGIRPSSIRRSGADATNVIIKTLELTSEEREALSGAIIARYGLSEDALLSSGSVGAVISREFRNSAIIATAIAVALMLLYITIRFSLRSGIAAVLCLSHDLFVMLAVYSILQIPMDSNVIAALLTILGYSINATIIVFDRVRENVKLHPEASFADIVDLSIRSTLARSINTTITTLFTIGMIFILGVESVRTFALPLIVGIIAGLFSSVCLAGSIWAWLYRVIPEREHVESEPEPDEEREISENGEVEYYQYREEDFDFDDDDDDDDDYDGEDE